MKKTLYILSTLTYILLFAHFASANTRTAKSTESSPTEQALTLSKKKWIWMINREVDSLDGLFHEDIISRQPGIKLDKPGHLDLISNGNMEYGRIDIISTDIQFIGDMSILLTEVKEVPLRSVRMFFTFGYIP